MSDTLPAFEATEPIEQQQQTATPSASEFPAFEHTEPTGEEKYGTTGQMLKTAAEGVAQGVAGPLAPYLETKLGIAKPEDILGRKEANPWVHGTSEATGLIGGALTGTGEGALLSKAGEAVEGLTTAGKAVNAAREAATTAGAAAPEVAQAAKEAWQAQSYLNKVGSSAVKQAVEMAVYQAGDEATKTILKDPDASAESALSNVGIASVLGGGIGAVATGVVSPLWKATLGPGIESSLKSLASKFGGIEGGANKTLAQELESKAGVEIPDTLKAVIDDVPKAREAHSVLNQDDVTMAGKHHQKTVGELYDRSTNAILETLGVSPKELEVMPQIDKYSAGREMGEQLANDLKPQIDRISNQYDKITEEFKNAPLSENIKREIADNIAQKSMSEGWHKAESEVASNLANRTIEKMGQQETLADLKNYMSNLRKDNPFGSPTYQAAKDIGNILKSAQERGIIESMSSTAEGQAKVGEYSALRGEYSKLMDNIDNLNEHLHVGRYDGPKSFLNSLKDLSTTSGEHVLSRMSGKNKANVIDVLKQYPATLEKVRQYHLSSLLDQASSKAKNGDLISVNNLLANLDKMSPQTKELVVNSAQQDRLNAINQILQGISDPTHNYSNTARTISKLTHATPSALSLLAALTGHEGAGLLSYLGKLGFGEGRAAVKLGMLKWLGSDAPIEAGGLKAAVSYANAAYKGIEKTNKAVANVLKPGAKVLTDSQMPSAKDLARLDKMVAQNQENPQGYIDRQQQSQVGHYMPDHQTALSAAATRAQQYLQNLKPHPMQNGPMDAKIPPSKEAVTRYERALAIAQEPAIVLKNIKEGTLQLNDLTDLKSIYPALYTQYAQKLTNEIAEAQSKNVAIPYHTKMSLSLFLGQPMDSTMQPSSIQAMQMSQMQPQGQPQQGQQPMQGRKGKSAISKQPGMFKTPGQAAESDRANRD